MSSTGAGSAQTPDVIPVVGFADGPFAALTESFARGVAGLGQGGAALTVIHHGRTVVDLVGGDYAPDSVQMLFSVTKAFAAVAAAHVHAEGLLDLDAPIAEYWPAFARASTAAITPRLVLSHRSGLAALDRELSLDELLAGADREAIETQEPFWAPGTAHGYHAFTFGTLLDGIFRHALGVTVGDHLRTMTAGTGWDLWLGTPASVLPRVQPIRYSAPRISAERRRIVAGSAFPPPPTGRLARTMDLYNMPAFLAAELPSASGVASARALAQFLDATLRDDGLLPSLESRRRLRATEAVGTDRVLGLPMHYGSGVQLPFPVFPMLGPHSYGHEGAGGSAAFADTEHDLAVGFTTDVYPAVMGASPVLLGLLPVIRHCVIDADRASGGPA
jgi:CubicO group peptidase (beta-lactamase class C family)